MIVLASLGCLIGAVMVIGILAALWEFWEVIVAGLLFASLFLFIMWSIEYVIGVCK